MEYNGLFPLLAFFNLDFWFQAAETEKNSRYTNANETMGWGIKKTERKENTR